jgi:sugar lactone lactonase YvrE
MRPAILCLLLTVPAACGGGDDDDDDTAGDPDAQPGAPDAAPLQCDSLPALPVATYRPIAVPSSEDFTFSAGGHLVGVTLSFGGGSSNNLVRTTYQGQTETILPAVGTPVGDPFDMTVRGVRFLPDGNFVFADRGSSSLVHLDMTSFVKTPLLSGVNEPNGVAVDMDGQVYLTSADREVVRVDPATGDAQTLYTAPVTLDGIAFGPGYDELYFCSEEGQVWEMPVTPTGAGAPTLIATIEAGGGGGLGLLDGLTVDACGNVYVVDMDGTIWRIAPDRTVERVVDIQTGGMFNMINAVNFGSGVGGWKPESLYVIGMASEAVYEVDLGVRGIPQPHL